jgi:hypothetical protein
MGFNGSKPIFLANFLATPSKSSFGTTRLAIPKLSRKPLLIQRITAPTPSNGKNLPLDALNIMKNGVGCQPKRITNI